MKSQTKKPLLRCGQKYVGTYSRPIAVTCVVLNLGQKRQLQFFGSEFEKDD